jgi:methyl-accepting chemotaxis protein
MVFTLKNKLISTFLAIGIAPVLVVAYVTYSQARDSEMKHALEKLEAVTSLKAKAIQVQLDQMGSLILSTAGDEHTQIAASQLRDAFYDLKKNIKEDPKLNESFSSYMNSEFAGLYEKNTGSKWSSGAVLGRIDPVQSYLSNQYIIENPFPAGEKIKLQTGKDKNQYNKAHTDAHEHLIDIVQSFGLYDLFLIDPKSGYVYYSAFKEVDFGSNLLSGPWASTDLAKVFSKAVAAKDGELVSTEFNNYTPSYDLPARFAATPVYSNGQQVAILAFQLPIDVLGKTLDDRVGLGETGESLLIGSDLLPRNDSFKDKENRSLKNSWIHKEKAYIDMSYVKQALKEKVGPSVTTDYFGKEVIAFAADVSFQEHKWIVLSTIETKEAFAGLVSLQRIVGSILIISLAAIFAVGWFFGAAIAKPLLRIASELGNSSKIMGGTTLSLSETSQKLSEMSTEQAAAIEETAASIEEISAMVKNNAEHSSKSLEVAETVRRGANEGNDSMAQAIVSMKGMLESNEKIQELVRLIEEIGEKTEIIDEIVFQTKLLSFNASVEAERAGEHGRGFAVVAQEVGNLAQLSGKAAQEISSKVKNSIRTAEQIAGENKSKVESGNQVIHDTAKQLRLIGENAEKMKKMSEQISTASKEQADGISQVTAAMSQLDQATQQNSATADVSAKNSDQLAQQTQNLQQAVQSLLKLVEGSSNSSAKPASKEVLKSTDAKVVSISRAPQSDFKRAVGSDVSGDEWDKM